MRRLSLVSFVVLAALLIPAVSRGAFMPGDGARLVRIEVHSGDDHGVWERVFPPGLMIHSKHQWSLPEPAAIRSQNKLLAMIDLVDVELIADPAVSLNFSVTAGNVPTTFTITSASLTFAPLTNPVGFATAAVTLTDSNNNGATLTGLLGGGKAYEGTYNGSTSWAQLVSGISAAVDSSAVGLERRPVSGWETIPATVSSMQSQFSFTLSPLDQASGTSRYEIVVPEPTSLSLLGLAALGLCRRWRR